MSSPRRHPLISATLAGSLALVGSCKSSSSSTDGSPPDGAGLADAGTTNDAGQALPITANRPERRDVTAALFAQLRVPVGFHVGVFASGVANARMLAGTPDGAVLATTPLSGQVLRLKDTNGDGDADDAGERTVLASAAEAPALEGVHGIALRGNQVYLASVKSVVVGTLTEAGTLTALQTLVSDLPDGGQHPNRTLAVGPDEKLYVSVGSDCNACPESNAEHATLLRFNLDGTPATNTPNAAHPMLAHNPASKISPRVWASGLRNTLGFAWHPMTAQLWGIDQGSDGLGEETPPEEINLLQEGKSYGWPYCWGNQQPDPTVDEPSRTVKKSDYCPTTEPPVSATLPAHSSPIAFLFYQGAQYPADYVNDAFLVLRGSWGRARPDGYKVVRIHYEGGVPVPRAGQTVPYEDFLAGFLVENGTAEFGRLAGLTVDASGALLVSDDENGVIYRVTYGAGGSPDGGAD